VAPRVAARRYPLGIDEWVYPVTWGGVGVAFVVAAVGPLVSLWRRWYMFIWPAVAVGVVIVSYLAGFALTEFSEKYWH